MLFGHEWVTGQGDLAFAALDPADPAHRPHRDPGGDGAGFFIALVLGLDLRGAEAVARSASSAASTTASWSSSCATRRSWCSSSFSTTSCRVTASSCPPSSPGRSRSALQYSAYTSEVYRAGIEAVPRGQWEAAPRARPDRAAHLHRTSSCRRRSRASCRRSATTLVSMLKDMPVLSVVTVLEMLGVAKHDRRPDLRVSGAASAWSGVHLPHSHAGRLLLVRLLERALPKRDSPSMTTEPTRSIRFDKVTKRFGALTVLDGLDFAVQPGEKVTLIGPSGSGKSTVLRILMTLERDPGGHDRADGRPLWHEERDGRLVPARARRTCARCASTSAWCSRASTSSRT